MMKDNRARAGRVYCHTTEQEHMNTRPASCLENNMDLSPIINHLIRPVGSGVVPFRFTWTLGAFEMLY